MRLSEMWKAVPGKKPLLILLALGAAYAATPAKVAWRHGIHKRWPMGWFNVEAPDGSRLTADDCVGRPTLVVVWAAWCPYMPNNIRAIERVKMRYRSTDACIVPASTDEKKETAFEFARSYGLVEPYYWGYDGLSSMYWSGRATPHSFVFDRDGNLVLSLDTVEGDYDTVLAAMDKVVHDGGVGLGPAPTAPGHEPGRTPEAVEADMTAREVLDAFHSEDFDALDALANQWRAARARTATDAWKEWIFYDRIALDPDDKTTDADFEGRIATFERWLTKRPGSVAAREALGRAWYQYAWRARGSGWSSEVTEVGRRLFEERLAKARPFLEQAEAMPDKSPVVYFTLLGLSLAQDRPDAESAELFRKALAFEPDYFPYYTSRLSHFLPRWGGSAEATKRFVEAAADGRGDGRGDELYARLVWELTFGDQEYDDPFQAGYSWPRVQAGCRALLARSPGERWGGGCAKLAVLAGDKRGAQEMFAKGGAHLDWSFWKTREAYRAAVHWSERPSLLERLKTLLGFGGIA